MLHSGTPRFARELRSLARLRRARHGAPILLLSSLFLLAACTGGGGGSEDPSATTEGSEDELVATFDKIGTIDLTKQSRILLVGDSHKLGELPLWSATTRARRYAQLYPNDQIVLFVTKDATKDDLTQAGSTVVKQEPFGTVALADLKRLSATKLVSALDRFQKIASLDFFGHSSPFGALLESEGEGRVLGPTMPANMGVLKDNFVREANPYVTLNGCNGGATVAPTLSKLLELPVSAALTGTNFQVLMSDGRWYFNDDGEAPSGTKEQKKNTLSFGPNSQPSCSSGACMRMKPQDSPYRGVWANPDTGFQYGLNFYKFFCDFPNEAACTKGMTESLYAFASTKPIDKNSSDEDVKEVLADFFCTGNSDAAWFDTCSKRLTEAVATGEPFSPMKSANDFTHECSFTGCEQKFRCKRVNGEPQQKTCVWVSAECGESQSAASCRSKNPKKQTAAIEYRRYLEGHALLRGH
jgi:hypothetical protein